MCLIVVAWQAHRDFPLVVAANRDEFYRRPSAVAARWQQAPGIHGGRDLEAGGTWLAASAGGRFAALTNVRQGVASPGARSRGELPAAFLRGSAAPEDYVAAIDGDAFAGFNLLVGDRETLCYLSNRDGLPRRLAPGIYAVSNHLLDTPWPKLALAKASFAAALPQLPDTSAFFALLADSTLAADADLPQTGVSLAWERTLSAIFVRSPDYGTRASTLLTRDRTGAHRLIERSFGPAGRLGEVELRF